MKKSIILILMCITGFCTSASADNFPSIFWEVSVFDPTTVGTPIPKSPIDLPQATLDGNVLTFESSHPAYALTLFDEDGFVVYQTAVSATTYTVVLPSTLTGTYVLTLDFGGSYYFWSEIEL